MSFPSSVPRNQFVALAIPFSYSPLSSTTLLNRYPLYLHSRTPVSHTAGPLLVSPCYFGCIGRRKRKLHQHGHMDYKEPAGEILYYDGYQTEALQSGTRTGGCDLGGALSCFLGQKRDKKIALSFFLVFFAPLFFFTFTRHRDD
jgi:hypothetical protein